MKVSEVKLKIMNTTVIISLTTMAKLWEWVLHRIREVVEIRGEFGLRTMGAERAILTTKH